ncbi:DNA replication/repair protein RecF [Leptolyngbya cf. ectocarpi LEGE 11479]|uniref:DNA replication and repair protein RecF n=1 Tax=Leptolyngbya cf. ectocarpi LEGE 11479 TaxID=1828722 RepID=A0A929FAB6_LEPEC|nr:DNA replication/repair protein RecF [Leptolyngbya ectocarpi]MBE9068317.1 DNA replication/repair protein RecF [Leptolyngbya cf. ectocarpi LEGE 11479]
MFLQSLHLNQFRNYGDQAVEFLAPKTILLGENAQGKSNLLEAVELLATLKSHRTSRDRDLVQTDMTTAQIRASLKRDLGVSSLQLTLRNGSRRTAVVNGETLRRQQDFLGHLNAVQFSCLDLELVRGGPGTRRTWTDTLLMQLEPVYIHILQQYGQVLKQRNALLKQQVSQQTNQSISPQPAEPNPPLDPTQLALWDAQLAALGTRVIRRRARMLRRLIPIAQAWHQAISGSTEQLEIHYSPNVAVDSDEASDIQQAFLDKLQAKAMAEYYQRTTLVGPHRDDISFLINETPARQYGSQGQQRTLVLALKLSELQLIEEVVGESPLLLLDDVLAELDLNRQNQLLDTIQDRFQTLITTTHLGSFDAQWLKFSQVLQVKNGCLETA